MEVVETTLEEMPGLCRDLLLALPGGQHQVVLHPADPSAPPAASTPRSRSRSVACGFPERRLRVTVRLKASPGDS